MNRLETVRLSDRTSLGIGGPADLFFEPQTAEELAQTLRFLDREQIPFWVLGGGTNTYFPDQRLDRAIISSRRLNRVEFDSDRIWIDCEAGVPLSRLIRLSLKRGWAGLESLVGIPGTIGGAVYGNAGSSNAWISECVESVEIVTPEGTERVNRSEIDWSYRRSGLCDSEAWLRGRSRGVICRVTLGLHAAPAKDLRARAAEVFDKKAASQPLTLRTAGCVFKNPGAEPAGRLIERVGLKGARVGGVEVSPVHANFIVNCGGGTAREFDELVQLVRSQVREKTGYKLSCEIRTPNLKDS